jgi:hypothetical protein
VKDWNELATRSGIEAVAAALREMPAFTHKAAALAAEAFAAIAAGKSTQQLAQVVTALVAACDLTAGYTDPADPFAQEVLTALSAELTAKARMTSELRRILDR